MADEWGSSAGDYDQRKFANEEEEDAPDAWDVDEDAEKKKKEEEEKAKATTTAAKAGRDATKDKVPKKLTKKEERAQKEEADRKRKEAEEEENDPAIKARRRKEQEDMARKRDNEFADGLFGGGTANHTNENEADEDDREDGDYEEGDYEDGEEDYADQDEQEEAKKPQPAAKASASPSKSASSASSAAKVTPPVTASAKSDVTSTTPVAAPAPKAFAVEKKEDLGYKVLDFKAAPVPAKSVAAPSSSSSAASSIDSMPLLSDEHFNSFATQLAKKLRSLSPAVNTPSVHSSRVVRLLRTVLQAAADVMTVDDVNEVKKSLMSIHQQKSTAVKHAKANPTIAAAMQKTATGRSAVGSNTLGRDIRATLNLKDDDDMFERNQATQAAERDAEAEDFM